MMSSNLAGQIESELGKRWYQPRMPSLRALYAQRREIEQRGDARLTARTAGILYALFSATDLILLNDVFLESLVARLVIGCLFVFCIDSEIRKGTRLSTVDRYSAAGIIVAYATWLIISSRSQYQTNVSYYVTYGTIFMMMQNIFFNLRFRLAVAASTCMLLSFLTALLTKFYVSFEYAIAIGTLYLSAYFLTLLVNWKLNEERYRVFLNSVRAELREQEVRERGEALLRLSTTDALTGLANRRAIDDELRLLWDNWQTAGKSFAVILIDIDFFKRYNDHYGHQEGDRCLIAVAEVMEAVTGRHQSALGRFGGEEFILLLRAHNREQMEAVAEEIRATVEGLQIRHEQRPDPSYVVTVSVGAAFSADVTGSKVERLVTEADRALYTAKRANRNCVRIFDANDPERLDLNESVGDLLRTALAEDRVAMVYQPIRQAPSGEIVAAEALMRLTAPNGKPVSPAVFIPIAEQTGGILELGRWAIATACRQVIANDLVPLVSVNVSAVQLKAAGFALSVAAILAETRVAPERLAIEVTEGLQIEGQPEIQQSILELRQLGVRIWLDDFGTGFAGLSCIRDIEFDVIKIDRSFLHASHTPKGREMFRNIVKLVKNASCRTVVEGIQTDEHVRVSSDHRVDMLQGFHLGRPMSADDLAALVHDEVASRPTRLSA